MVDRTSSDREFYQDLVWANTSLNSMRGWSGEEALALMERCRFSSTCSLSAFSTTSSSSDTLYARGNQVVKRASHVDRTSTTTYCGTQATRKNWARP